MGKMKLDEILLFILIGIITTFITLIVAFIVFHRYFTNFTKSSQNLVETAGNLTIANSNLQNQISNIETSISTQLEGLRGAQQQLSVLQTETSMKFQNFLDLIKMKSTAKGELGETIVRWVLENIPDTFWEEQVTIKGGRVDFRIRIPPENKYLLIDSKFWTSDELIEQGSLIFTNEKHRKEINKIMKKRGLEVAKYIMPENNTIGFALMVIPDLVYSNLSPDTYQKLALSKVVAVGYSGLYSCIMIVSKQIQLYRISQALDQLGEINDFIDTKMNKLKDNFRMVSKHLDSAAKNVTKAEQEIEDAHKRIKERMGLLELNGTETKIKEINTR